MQKCLYLCTNPEAEVECMTPEEGTCMFDCNTCTYGDLPNISDRCIACNCTNLLWEGK